MGGVRKGCVAAFGVSDPGRGTERFVVVAETRLRSRNQRERLQSEVIERVATTLGIPPDVVVPCAPGSVLKTSSGKIRRSATRDLYLAGRLSRGRPWLVTQWSRLFVRTALARLSRWGGQMLELGFTAYVLILLALTGPVVWAVLALGPPGPWVTRLVGRWTRAMLAVTGCRVDVIGLDRLHQVGPAVYVANHASYLDPVLMMAVLPIRLRSPPKDDWRAIH